MPNMPNNNSVTIMTNNVNVQDIDMNSYNDNKQPLTSITVTTTLITRSALMAAKAALLPLT